MIKLWMTPGANIDYQIDVYLISGIHTQQFKKTGTISTTKDNPYEYLLPELIKGLQEINQDLNNHIERNIICPVEYNKTKNAFNVKLYPLNKHYYIESHYK